MTPVGQRRIWVSLFVLVVFILGVATGMGVGRVVRFGPPFGRGRPPGPPPPPSPAILADRLTRELQLSPAQRATLEGILEQGGNRLERFHAETGQQFETLRRDLDADIERVLTPDQQARFRERRPLRPRRPPPGEGPPDDRMRDRGRPPGA